MPPSNSSHTETCSEKNSSYDVWSKKYGSWGEWKPAVALNWTQGPWLEQPMLWQITLGSLLSSHVSYRYKNIKSIKRCSPSVLLSAVEMSCTTWTALVLAHWPSSEIIYIRMCVPRIVAAATIWGQRLLRSEVMIMQLLRIWGQRLFEKIQYCLRPLNMHVFTLWWDALITPLFYSLHFY